MFELNRVISNIREQIPQTASIKFEYVPSSLNWADAPSRGKRIDIEEMIRNHRLDKHNKRDNYVSNGVVDRDSPLRTHSKGRESQSVSRDVQVMNPLR